MRQLYPAAFLILIIFSLVSCAPPTPLPPLPTATPLPPTATPTATEIWFPPTPTFTPPATRAAIRSTVETFSPEYGTLLFEDEFTDPSIWRLSQSPVGSAAFGVNELTIAIRQPRGYLYSERVIPDLRNFYAEIIASPSICRGEDEYGLLFRITPAYDFYRFSLTCDGQTRLDKYYRGAASSPQPLNYSSEVPPGAPSETKIGVWIMENEMRFFINDVFQFSVMDPSITSGLIGVFARAFGEDPVTVNFSTLKVFQAE